MNLRVGVNTNISPVAEPAAKTGAAAANLAAKVSAGCSGISDQVGNADALRQAHIQELTTGADHAVANLGQSLAGLDRKLGAGQDRSLAQTMNALWNDAKAAKTDAVIVAKANAIFSIGGKTAAAIEKLGQDHPKSKVIANAVVRDFQAASSKVVELLKAAKMDMEKEKIHQLRSEAGERFDHAMTAATKEMSLGIVSAGAQIAAGIGAASAAGSRAGIGQAPGKKSDEIQSKLFLAEQQINKADLSKKDTAVENASDRKKAMLDAIQKILDLLTEMNPKI
jgi:hypothetical protein